MTECSELEMQSVDGGLAPLAVFVIGCFVAGVAVGAYYGYQAQQANNQPSDEIFADGMEAQ